MTGGGYDKDIVATVDDIEDSGVIVTAVGMIRI